MSRFLALTASAEFQRRLTVSLGRADELQVVGPVTPGGSADGVLSRNPGGPVDVIIFGPDSAAEHTVAMAAALDRLHPGTVLVWAAALTPEQTLTAMRSGIRDVITPDAEAEQLRAALERAALAATTRRLATAAEASQPRPRGRVISVMSPKGGVGKTTVATNLAVGLAKSAPMGAVIVDLDLQFGDVASGLGLEPENTISDAVTAEASHDAMVLKAFLSHHSSGAYAMCAPLRPAEADLIKPAHITTLINQLSLEFPYVILDTSPGIGDVVLAVLELATDGVWVCGMDIPSIRGLNHGLEVLRQLDLMPASNTIVLNFADKRSGLTVEDVESTVGLPVDILLPRSKSLPFSTNAGVPLLQDNRRDPALKGLRALVDRLLAGSPSAAGKSMHRKAEIS
ncbi:MinD/ParA family protein [Arthrobacter sp. UKPF54-2]|uniref:AAA family ATPase n=1 Tax=Arthrobacter sp. UKPF54-2 TaxID=2600159 RepID=UPI0011B16618|nr:AAA family ATPase [Arthrobacter sp. UKPF54-2]QDY90418.1 MinD/ParA family protein [Arthrobacter sp. UKPF54-2]